MIFANEEMNFYLNLTMTIEPLVSIAAAEVDAIPQLPNDSTVQPPNTTHTIIPNTTRLIIKQMVLENFKSYAGRVQIGPFHKVQLKQSI